MTMTATVTVAKNGKRHYALYDGDSILDTRKSDRDYSHIVVIEVTTGQPVVEYAGRLDLAQKRVAAYESRDSKRQTKWVVSTHIVPVEFPDSFPCNRFAHGDNPNVCANCKYMIDDHHRKA